MTYQHALKCTISGKWVLFKLLMAPLSCFMVATNINIWHTFMTTALVTMKVTMATITTFFHWWKQCCWKCICFWGKWYSYLFFMLLLLSIDFPQRPILLLMIKDYGNYKQWLIITSSMVFLPMEIVVISFFPRVLTAITILITSAQVCRTTNGRSGLVTYLGTCVDTVTSLTISCAPTCTALRGARLLLR